MDESNPYASPLNPYSAPQTVSEPVSNEGIWRDGKVLVMHRQAVLPDICIKSNEPTNGFRLKRKLSWHSPLLALSILVNVLLYIILAAIFSKRATIMVPLTDKWRAKRRNRVMITWLTVIGGILSIVVGIALIDQNGNMPTFGGLAFLIGIFVLLFGILYGLIRARLVTPAKIDDQYVRFKGAHPDYLNRFDTVTVQG